MSKAKMGHGGRRKGAGRKAKPRYFSAYDAAGPMPADPLERVSWINHLLAIDLKLIISGHGDRAVSQELRATARAILAGIPKERLWLAEQAVRGDHAKLKKTRKDPRLVDVSNQPGIPLSGTPHRG